MTPDAIPNPTGGMPAAQSDGLMQQFEKGGLFALRAAVAAHGSRLGLAGDRLDNLTLVAHELASNAIQHGGGRGQLHLWRDGDAVHCRVEDWGGGITTGADVGLHTPSPGALRGRGLWLVRQLADEVEVRTGSAATTVTVTIRLNGMYPSG